MDDSGGVRGGGGGGYGAGYGDGYGGDRWAMRRPSSHPDVHNRNDFSEMFIVILVALVLGCIAFLAILPLFIRRFCRPSDTGGCDIYCKWFDGVLDWCTPPTPTPDERHPPSPPPQPQPPYGPHGGPHVPSCEQQSCRECEIIEYDCHRSQSSESRSFLRAEVREPSRHSYGYRHPPMTKTGAVTLTRTAVVFDGRA